MDIKTGIKLTKISAIIDLVIAGALIILGLIATISISFFDEIPYDFIFPVLVVILINLVEGILLLIASRQMKNTKTAKIGAIIAICLGIISSPTLTGIPALIGGIITLINLNKK